MLGFEVKSGAVYLTSSEGEQPAHATGGSRGEAALYFASNQQKGAYPAQDTDLWMAGSPFTLPTEEPMSCAQVQAGGCRLPTHL